MADIPSSSATQLEASNPIQAPPNALNIEANRPDPTAILEELWVWTIDTILRLLMLILILLFGYFIVYNFVRPKYHGKHKFKCKPDSIVALDGSGNFTSVFSAVAAAPNNSNKKHCIFIKSGIYGENVVIGQTKKNIVFMGEGMKKTVITSDVDNGTVMVFANGFMAINLTIENSAEEYKENAVAFLSLSDQSVLYWCIFRGYQHTLSLAMGKQFFKDCTIYGTFDFIFGDATIVFQNCNVYVRNPLPTKSNVITAQGGIKLKTVTGFTFHHCIIDTAPDAL